MITITLHAEIPNYGQIHVVFRRISIKIDVFEIKKGAI